MTQPLRRTPLYETHVALKARLVPFAGWEMPVQYSGILNEARAVRTNAGLFDVSHMGRLHISGPDAVGLLEWACTNEVAKLQEGRARYTLVCNEQGGILDDCVYYRLAPDRFLFICNAANRDAVKAWLTNWSQQRFPQVRIEDRTDATAMIALQGRAAMSIVSVLASESPARLRPFGWMETTLANARAFIGRTGYTGEDGVEIVVAAKDAAGVWEACMEQSAVPCGLGARDVLRLEAGLPLHGNDIDAGVSPLEAGLERFVKMEADHFCGHDALAKQQQGLQRRLVGLRVQGKTMARHGQKVLVNGAAAGVVTSGSFSPTLQEAIAMAYVPVASATPGNVVQVDVRGNPVDAVVTELPFYVRKRRP